MRTCITRLQSPNNTIGGSEQSAWLHAKILNELGHEAQLFSDAPFKSANFWHRLKAPRNKWLRFKWAFLYFPFKALVGRYDLLNPHSRVDQIALSLTKWLHRTPVVWKDPGDLVHQIWLIRPNLLGRLNQKLLIAAIKRADAIYMLNVQDRATILDRLNQLGHSINQDKLRVIPSDILFTDYNLNPTSPNRQILQNNGITIGSVGRLDEHKGLQHLLSAGQILAQNHKNLEYWIIGDGPYRPELEQMATASKLSVKFWGQQRDISPYLNSIDIFVQPAEFEGWGRTVKEAMYFSKPVVGSNIGGIAEQIKDGETGLLFEPKNADELAQKLELLIKNKSLRTKLGKAGHTQAIKNGDYNDLIKNQILPLFKSVIKAKH